MGHRNERPLVERAPPPIADPPSRWKIIRLAEVDSTQDVARALGEVGTAVVAGAQRRGRGRRGASWHSPPGGLWLSAVLPPPAPAHVQVAAAVARALRKAFSLPISVDPPNDLGLRGRKLGGVLVETSYRGEEAGPVVVGIGINVNNPLPDELAGVATSLREELGRPVDLGEVLALVLSALDDFRGVRECRE